MKNNAYLILIALIIQYSCAGENSDYPIEKRYWDAEDYDAVVMHIKYHKPSEEPNPKFENPETAVVVKKLVDPENFRKILNDKELGLQYRSDVAERFFEEYRGMVEIYSSRDRQDKFVYDDELVAVLKFGLELQIDYFKIGNENIEDQADDPTSSRIQSILRDNERTIFKNFNNYLDFVNYETGFSPKALEDYIDGINTYFPLLYETFPGGNPELNRSKAELMLKKAENKILREALENLLLMISES